MGRGPACSHDAPFPEAPMRSFAPPPAPLARRQRGVIMVIALITLAVLLIGAAAAMKSMNVTLANVGYYRFKREITNQGERAIR